MIQGQLFDTHSPYTLKLHVLGSGSRGNACVVEGVDGAILVDAGFSARELCTRLDALGIARESIKALVLTHEHSDHSSGAGVISRRLSLPVYATAGTLDSRTFMRTGARDVATRITAGHTMTLAGIRITPFPTHHDAAQPVGFRFEQGHDAIGYMTDTGEIPAEATEMLADVRVLALESNHDMQMLMHGPYPYHLKQRIKSATGHLSNEQAATALAELASSALEQVVAMHLSETNNLPLHSDKALREVLAGLDHPAHVQSAGQHRPRTCESLDG